ncbi:hypothetical protein DMUE_5433 [Dictyocoela muelleri]|nr:hypothetical protein DMUE_5433 [Dictyocoela muelleri]
MILRSSILTTNAIEGWHRPLNFNVRVYHPDIRILVNELKNEQVKVEYNIIQLIYESLNQKDHNISKIQNNSKNQKTNLLLQYVEKYNDFLGVDFLKVMASLFEIKTD